MVWGGTTPGTTDASVSFDWMSTTPNRMKFVASVVMNEGTFNSTVMRPLIIPTPQATSSAATMDHPTGSPSCQSQNMTHGVNKKTWPAERSISPSISTRTSPIAIPPIGPAKPTTELMDNEVRNDEESTTKKRNSATVIRIGVTSRCATKARHR